MDDWLEWLGAEVRKQSQRRTAGETRRPAVQPEGPELHAHAGG
jgi:hypothetical protein